MRTPEELERLAFRERLSADEDHCLFEHCRSRAQAAQHPRGQIAALKQAAFFAMRAFDKGSQAPARLQEYIGVLVQVQQRAPTPSFRRKCAEMRSVAAGRSHAADQVRAAWAYGVPQHLLPFVECNGDYFCFDMRVRLPEPPVVLCAHDGQSDEIWPTFAAWVEEEGLPSAE